MGFGNLVRKAKARMVAEAIKRFLGSEGMDFLKKNKAFVGTALGFIAGGLAAIGQTEAASFVGMVSALLIGGGAIKSDAEHRASSK